MTSSSTPAPMALVTGGSSGIGLALARQLAQRGYSLLLVSNQQQELNQLSVEIQQQHGVLCETMFLDLTLADAAQRVFEHCQQRGWQIDVLINNAGILVFSEAARAPLSQIHNILQLHIYTPVMLCRLFGAEMMTRHSGRILNVSSISSVMPYPGISLYGPTKTFMRYYSRALGSEMKIHGITVTCLIPGATATALYDPQRVNITLAMRLGIMHSPDFVASKALRAMWRGKAECIPGLLNKLTVLFLPLVPHRLIHLIHRHSSLLEKGIQAF